MFLIDEKHAFEGASSCFWSKMLKFVISYFCVAKSWEMMFGDVLDGKQAFPEYENISFYLAAKLMVF